MRIDNEEVRRIARLARIDLDESAAEELRADLARILDHVAVLEVLDTEGVPATARTSEDSSHLREDRPGPSLPPGRASAQAPEAAEGFFRVPRVLR